MRIAIVLVALAGCATDDRATDEDYADTAMSLGSTCAHHGGEASAMADAITIATGGVPTGFTRDADGAIRGRYFGLEYHYSVVCRDAAGVRLDACDARTDAADVDAAWSGTLDLPELAMSLQRSGHWALAGIQGGVTRIGGDGHLAYDTTSFRFGYDASYDTLVAAGRPVGGWTHYAVSASKADRTFTIDADVMFHGTTAELVLDGDHRYVIDLATGDISAAP